MGSNTPVNIRCCDLHSGKNHDGPLNKRRRNRCRLVNNFEHHMFSDVNRLRIDRPRTNAAANKQTIKNVTINWGTISVRLSPQYRASQHSQERRVQDTVRSPCRSVECRHLQRVSVTEQSNVTLSHSFVTCVLLELSARDEDRRALI